MTIAGALWPRHKLANRVVASSESRLFQVAPHTRILAHCSIDKEAKDRPTLIIVHGLEGSSNSPDIVNLAAKAMMSKVNVVRLNLRNCGGTLHLTPTLYNAGNSDDVLAVVKELKEKDELEKIVLVGYSLGGNIAIKLAGELADKGALYLSAICGVSPSIDLAACVNAIENGFNRVYEQRFLYSLKEKIRQKNKLFPQLFKVDPLKVISGLRRFDDLYTAPDAGFRDSADYYKNCSALKVIERVAVPTLIIAAQDDPFVPFESFKSEKLLNPYITLLAPAYGGHAGFINGKPEQLLSIAIEDRFWAENRVLQFLRSL